MQENKVYVCAHCGRVDTQTRSWHPECKRHAFETTDDCVIQKKGKIGMSLVFYDPNPEVVANKRKELGYG